jgi:hypothetical protein
MNAQLSSLLRATNRKILSTLLFWILTCYSNVFFLYFFGFDLAFGFLISTTYDYDDSSSVLFGFFVYYFY